MQIPLLEGRPFDDRDGIGEIGHPLFVIVNHAFAARFWPGQTAVGKRLRSGPDPWFQTHWLTVAGVVGDVRYAGVDALPDLDVYLPERLFPQSAITLLVKTAGDPSRVVDDVRAGVARVDREAFVMDVRTMDGLVADSLSSRWLASLLVGVCGALGLVLALTGIYGIVTQAVVQRRFEIGVRLALGSTPSGVVRLMLQRAIRPIALGGLIGLVCMTAIARLLSTMLFQTPPFDPVTLVATTGLFLLVAIVAALVPARRAARVDPLVALRCE
jgi:hypothetical protein